MNLYRGLEELLAHSSLNPEVLEEIEKVFVTDRASDDIDKTLIDDSTIRLLEELSVPHAKIALNEFAHRCKVAPEKIRKSTAGYLRGVCLKYWKIGRAATKQQLADAYRKRLELGERVNKRKLIEDFIGHTFTPGSQLDLLLIDSTVRKKLFQLEPCDALDVIFEFVSAVTFRTSKIRNINAYMMSMINKAKTSGQMKTIDEILNRQKYGLPKSPDSHAAPAPNAVDLLAPQDPPPDWVQNDDHEQRQEWFRQKVADGEEFRGPSSPEESSPTTVWSPSANPERFQNPDPESGGMEMDKFGNYGPSVENYQSPAQTPLYADTQSFFSKNDPTHSLSYVSDKDGDGSNSTDENREDNSTGSPRNEKSALLPGGESSSGHVTPHEAVSCSKQEKEFLEETIRQQNKVIQSLRKKIRALEGHLQQYEDRFEHYEENYFSQTPSHSFPHSPSNMTTSDGIKSKWNPSKEADPAFDWKMQNTFHRFDDYTRPRQRSEPTMNNIRTHQRSASYSCNMSSRYHKYTHHSTEI
jgi:hypothetical protein